MASKMRLFQIVRNMYRMTGINATNPSLNWKICIVLTSQMLLFSSTTGFLLFKANSVPEYGSSFSGCVMILANILFFIVNVLKMPTTIELIEKFEDFIGKSEYHFNGFYLCFAKKNKFDFISY